MSRRRRGPAPVLLVPDTPPVVDAVRKPGRLLNDGQVWVVRCPYCSRRHKHPADPVATSLVVTARCSTVKFYKVQEAEDG